VLKYLALFILLLIFNTLTLAYAQELSENEFNEFFQKTITLKHQSPTKAIQYLETKKLSDMSQNQQVLIADEFLSVYVNQGKLEQASDLNKSIKQYGNTHNIAAYKIKYWLNDYVLNTTQGNKERALNSAIKAKDMARINNIEELKAKALLYIGTYYRDISEYNEAERNFQQALTIVDQNDELRAQILNQLGAINNRKGNPLKAIDYLNEALAIHVEMNNLTEVSNIYYSIAQTNFNMQNFELALENYLETNRLDKELGNKNNQAYSATNICSLYGWFGEFDKAKQTCDEARDIFTKQNSKSNMAGVNNSFGQTLFKQEKFTELELLMRETLEEYAAYTNKYVLIKTRSLLIKSLIGQKKYNAAEEIALQVKKVADENTFSTYAENILMILSNIYLGQGDNKSAIEYAHQYIEVMRESRKKVEDKRVERHKNNIDSIMKSRDLERLTYQNALNEKALTIKDQQLKIWGGLAIIIIVLVLGYSYLVLQKRKLSLKERDLLDEIIQKKNQLLADVSHELRTPLAVLKMQIQSLEFNFDDNKEQAYQALHRRITEINRLISDIYELSRADASDLDLDKESVFMYSLLNNWCTDMKGVVGAIDGLTFSYDLKINQDISLVIDQTRFIQVLSNLLSNSQKYTDRPGELKLSAFVEKKDLVIVIEDSSPGVDVQELNMIFERLYRVDQSRSREDGGTGLGLAICKSLTEAQGGSICAQNSPLGGISVEVRYPL